MSGSVTLVNDTNIGLRMTTSVLYSASVDIWPGQEGTLSDLNTGPLYNPRTIKVKPMNWWDSTPERKAAKEKRQRWEAVAGTLGAGGVAGNLAAATGEALGRLAWHLAQGNTGELQKPDWAEILYKNAPDRPIQVNYKMWQDNSAEKGEVDVEPKITYHPRAGDMFDVETVKLRARGGLNIEANSYDTQVWIEYAPKEVRDESEFVALPYYPGMLDRDAGTNK